VRPGITRLERLVATAREQAHMETYRRLTPLLTPAQQAWLDSLLVGALDDSYPSIFWSRSRANT
jgi:hypothetical protein